ncbi:MAG TPA: glutamine--fructose-6-phosphate transaminase (isomerizing), partial [Calditrichaeota bacterium]|nr:glutamine--fructose-6-phosphate transaminase (isomerizing) [Calditrichota bacterium]
CNNQVSVVHNGIIENHQLLKQQQLKQGFKFTSETDTEVIVHAIFSELDKNKDLFKAVQIALTQLEGAYALGVIAPNNPDELIAARKGSPLVIGVGIGEYFIASDVSALLPVTQQFMFLEDGDIAKVTRDGVLILDKEGKEVVREIKLSNLSANSVELGGYRHYMQKEIFEQPQSVKNTLEGRVIEDKLLVSSFGHQAEEIFKTIKQLQIIACGTSYHAGLVAKYWVEDILQLPCQVEVASEYRYRNPVIQTDTLFVTISQSGETADTLAALKQVKQLKGDKNIPTLSICNVPESSLTRESDLIFLTLAGPEIGVASTKAFTTQLVSLALLVTALGKVKNIISERQEQKIVAGLQKLPNLIQ